MNAISEVRMNKTAFSIVSLNDESDEKNLAHEDTAERLETVELCVN
jgi:hypothetical protein